MFAGCLSWRPATGEKACFWALAGILPATGHFGCSSEMLTCLCLLFSDSALVDYALVHTALQMHAKPQPFVQWENAFGGGAATHALAPRTCGDGHADEDWFPPFVKNRESEDV